ncbi:hypothetical protein [uncultured Desulfobacter sp.]|uniref:hypothetical protein n=1 Tax=uncultured Desulfobacter sp. TaxID=240139 RepID=UPI002AAAEC2E|nr:hypothetical protein [uncultured Desulfobacter sp.]
MNEDKNECLDPTQSLTVQLPCQMVERMERFANENGTDVGGVLIEAIDRFLRDQNRA